MAKKKPFLAILLRTSLVVAAVVAVQTFLVWLLLRNSSRLQHIHFADALLLLGVVEAMMTSLGRLWSKPYDPIAGPRGVQDLPVHPSEGERQHQMTDEMLQRRSFSIHMLAIGILTILVSVGITYLGEY